MTELTAEQLAGLARAVKLLTECVPLLVADMQRDVRRCANYQALGDMDAAWSVALPWVRAAGGVRIVTPAPPGV